jgi:hypothetical protein
MANKVEKRSLQSTVSKKEYEAFQQQIKNFNEHNNLNLTESAYIRKLILDDIKKGNTT